MTEFEKWQEKRGKRKRDKKEQKKEKDELKKKQSKMTAEEVEAEAKTKAQLELLVPEKRAKRTEVDKDDARFATAD